MFDTENTTQLITREAFSRSHQRHAPPPQPEKTKEKFTAMEASVDQDSRTFTKLSRVIPKESQEAKSFLNNSRRIIESPKPSSDASGSITIKSPKLPPRNSANANTG